MASSSARGRSGTAGLGPGPIDLLARTKGGLKSSNPVRAGSYRVFPSLRVPSISLWNALMIVFVSGLIRTGPKGAHQVFFPRSAPPLVVIKLLFTGLNDNQ